MENENMEPKKFVFKQYYDSNPEFKAKHIANMIERIDCPCGAKVMRSNITRHMKSKLHVKRLKGAECNNDFHKKQTKCDICGSKYTDFDVHSATHNHKKALKKKEKEEETD